MPPSSVLYNFLVYQSNFILDLQNLFGENNDFLRKVSRYSDPSYAITILFPVFSSLDTKLGFQVLLVSSITEWANTLLKWLIAEGRPYWWVAEAKVHIPLRQTDVSCETGPGSPSGHVMGTAALAYVFLHWLQIWFSEIIPPERKKTKITVFFLLWSVYTGLVTLVSLSRINLAAHFPHQCLVGALLGIFLAQFLIKQAKWTVWQRIYSYSKAKMLMWAIFLTIISAGSYGCHHLLGYDAGWSIKMAFKWCERPHSISVYTTPIYSLVRDSGCFFAMAISSPIKERKFYPIVGSTVTILFFISAKMLRPIMPTNDPLQFYLFHFLDNLFTSLCLLTIVPYIASLVRFKEKKA